ncbi:hypothetical protein SAMN04488061_2833 [Filomicrobium insigne]|uniref:Uncharacterized protein n=1 Tax=Filomicrobium insigne TaxID=418854 RepID=A0A1H0SC96_9HYPH|nr:hypothetical protein [Filomicrobium insigne]SDP39383.1 hypothetical protein SAMN04488061_2833 [Filomicrobium insigne]
MSTAPTKPARLIQIKQTHFGPIVWISPLGAGGDICDMVIVGVQKSCFIPVAVKLPHQLYVDSLTRMLDEHEANEILILPALSKNYVRLDRDFLSSEPHPRTDQDAREIAAFRGPHDDLIRELVRALEHAQGHIPYPVKLIEAALSKAKGVV